MSNLSQFAAGGDPQYWVSGTTYALGKTVRSPTDHQRYVRVVDGAGTTDPANDATNWRPDGGRAIKSVQRGQITIPQVGIPLTAMATISAVNTAKSDLTLLGWSVNNGSVSAAPRLELTNSTTITVTRVHAGAPDATTAAWQLVEYY